jgi:hypothetical protein
MKLGVAMSWYDINRNVLKTEIAEVAMKLSVSAPVAVALSYPNNPVTKTNSDPCAILVSIGIRIASCQVAYKTLYLWVLLVTALLEGIVQTPVT